MIALLLPAIIVLPVDTLIGRVTDATGQPIPLAVVEIAEGGQQITTGADGTFRLVVAAGRYTLTVRRPGYGPSVRAVTVPATSPLDFVLAPSPLHLEPVTVTAMRRPIAVSVSPLPAASLGGAELRAAQGTSLAHVLTALPGVRAVTTGAQIGKPMIRGLSGPRVLVLDNGSRLEDYSWSDEDGPSVETGFVRRVEVIRGPASVLYGSDALGGVVNVVPEPLPDAMGGPRFIRTGFALSGASNNIELGVGGRVEGASGPMGWRIAATGRGAGNLHTPAGELENTGFGALNGEGTIGWRWPSGGALAIRAVHYGGEFKLLEANAPPGEEGGPERKLGDERLQITALRPAGSFQVEAKGQIQRHSLIEMADDSTGAESEAFNLLLQTSSLDLMVHEPGGGGTIGVSGLLQTNAAAGRVPLVPDARTIAGGIFAFERRTLGPLTLLGGLRYDLRRLHVDSDSALGVVDQDRSSNAHTYNVGVVYGGPAGVSLSVNVGGAWRAPTLFELYANGPHIGEARYEQGDSSLDPESSRSVDVGVRWGTSHVQLEVSAYHNRIDDYIYITPTAVFIDSLRVYQYGQAEAELLGGELLVDAALSNDVVVRGRLEAVRGTNLTAHEPLPLVPPLRGSVGLYWRDRLRIDVEALRRPERLNPLDVPTAGYALLHVGGGAPLRLFGRETRLDVAVRNVLDQRYRSFLSRYKEFALDQGRNIIVRVSTGVGLD